MAIKERQPVDDEGHEVLYISPGDCPGGHGRTYSWKKVHDEEERDALIEQGYSADLLEAYEKAGKPVPAHQRAKGPEEAKRPTKRGLPPPKAVTKAPPEERDPITGDPVETAKPAATLDDVKAALAKLKDEKDAKAVVALLKKFGATAAPKLEEAQYADVIAAAEKALKE